MPFRVFVSARHAEGSQHLCKETLLRGDLGSGCGSTNFGLGSAKVGLGSRETWPIPMWTWLYRLGLSDAGLGHSRVRCCCNVAGSTNCGRGSSNVGPKAGSVWAHSSTKFGVGSTNIGHFLIDVQRLESIRPGAPHTPLARPLRTVRSRPPAPRTRLRHPGCEGRSRGQ